MRKTIIAGNWKMNKTVTETKDFLEKLILNKINDNVEAVVIVPFTSAYIASNLLKNFPVSVGCQNMYYEENGAFTGEISPLMLKDIGIEYVVIGHSERREIFKENDELVNNKVLSALKHNLKPIICCGEVLKEREDNKQKEKVEKQITIALKNVKENELKNVVIAYEPIWAIGTGKTASSDDAEDMCSFIRKLIEKLYSKKPSEEIRIQYGGSVKPNNIKEIMSKENIDGALVGGASLEVNSFLDLVNY